MSCWVIAATAQGITVENSRLEKNIADGPMSEIASTQPDVSPPFHKQVDVRETSGWADRCRIDGRVSLDHIADRTGPAATRLASSPARRSAASPRQRSARRKVASAASRSR